MFNIKRKEINWLGRNLSLETGKIARQADGAVVVTYGETVVLCTVVFKKEAKEGVDFFPLTVSYQEKYYSAGKIPGGFFKRESRPSERETLISRLIDRPIRPLFPEGFYNEVQVICTVLSFDGINEPDVVGMIGASAALAICGVPFDGPIAGIRVGYSNGEYIYNPTFEQLKESQLELVLAGTATSVLMVESEAKVLSEEIMLQALASGHKEMQPVIELIKEFVSIAGKPAFPVKINDYSELQAKIAKLSEKTLRSAYKETDKQARVAKISAAKETVVTALKAELAENYVENTVQSQIKNLEKKIVRNDILDLHKRIDGRGEKDVRNIVSEVNFLPRTHGSALFTRGETQALVVVTLGTKGDAQIVDDLIDNRQEGFLLHYNFPPYSVGEASQLRAPGRREIGHGKLAWRALRPVMPNSEQFPYTVRLVSEITESNGSSSMATVCGSSLALMDAGVPIESMVAGIAMGLIKEGDKFSVLSDILGDEDHLGDMDFKVAGTKDGITSLQMDIKINGITIEIMEVALNQAKEGRTHILGKMQEAMTEPRKELNKNAPRIHTIQISKEKIGAIIGPGGKVIREICEKTGAKIDINDDGLINIASVDGAASEAATAMILDIVREVEPGKIYEGRITKIFDFGLLVEFLGKTEGLVHISEISDQRIENLESLYNLEDKVKVKVLGFERNKIRLSLKRVNQETGDDISDQFEEERRAPSSNRDRGDRGGRGGDRGGNRRRSDDRRGGDRDRDNNGGDRDRGSDRDNRNDNSDERRSSRDNDSENRSENRDEDGARKKRKFF